MQIRQENVSGKTNAAQPNKSVKDSKISKVSAYSDKAREKSLEKLEEQSNLDEKKMSESAVELAVAVKKNETPEI